MIKYILASLLIAQGLSLYIKTLIKQRSEVDPTNWMNQLPDETNILDMMIPGVHDTQSDRGISASVTQTLSIPAMLSIGVRYFDVRLCTTFFNIKMCHGATIIGNFEDFFGSHFLQYLQEFLSGHPKETIFV